jgi:exopolyphosphatase / guanosine-5'-triphosphate,3'-diphosphate pyrophosphatase
MGRVLATVDIGSNTAHLLVAETADGTVRKIVDDSDWLSLGEIVGRERSIPQALQDTLIKTLNGYKKQASDQGAEGIYIFATEAVRAANNNREVLKRLEQSGLKVELISGQKEAEFGLRGVLLDSGFSSFLLAEVGGGSAQVAHCSRKRIKSEASLPLGTGTLIAKLGLSCPCDYAHLKRTQRLVEETLENAEVLEEGGPLVACGGVARGLWRALHPDGNRVLHVEELNFLIWSTQRLTAEQIVQRFQVKPKRALTLFPGAVVYKQIMERSGQEEMTISRFGVREGALLEMAEGKVSTWRV